MRNVITTKNDLRVWVDNHWHEDVDAVTEAIRAGEHPAWGADWTEFLAAMPDDLSTLLTPVPESS